MTKIKICGIRTTADIEIVNKYKPDYIGFIFAESRRMVSIEKAQELIQDLDKEIKTVGVFVNSGIGYVVETAKTLNLDAVQLHGDENSEYITALTDKMDCEVWKAIRVRGKSDIDNMDSVAVKRIVLDKYKENEYGGSGETFNWNECKDSNINKSIILAGGLDENNVIEGIMLFAPYAVDVSSNIETDGYKDEDKVREFIEKVRTFNE